MFALMVRSFIGEDTALSLQRDEFDSRTNRHNMPW